MRDVMASRRFIPFLRSPFKSRRLNAAGKRLVDFTAASFGLLALSPLFLFLAWRIRRDSPGPVFFWGDRVGRSGRRFKILKFRTMYEEDATYKGPRITARGDSRITPVGKWLRDTKLNELPQLWNVLKGDMSLVGPRPEDPKFVETWPDEARREILSVRPGITSPASVLYRDEEQMLSSDNVMDDYLRTVLPSKLRLDTLYVRSWSLLADLDVLFWTLMILIPQARKQSIPETDLYWGPFSFFFTRLFSWFLIDFSISMISVGLVAGIWRTITPLDIGWRWGVLSGIGMAIVFSLFNLLFKNHLVYWQKASPREAFDLVFATTLAAGTIWLLDGFVVRRIDIPDGLYIVAGLLACAGFIAARYRERILTGLAWRWLSFRKIDSILGERVLVVGAGELGEFAIWLLRNSDFGRAFSVIGMVDDDPRKQNLQFDGLKILGGSEAIPELVREFDPGLILFAISNIGEADRRRILNICKKTGVRVVLVPNIMKLMQQYFSRATADDDSGAFDRPQIDVSRVSGWLAELEELAAAGNSAALEARIRQIRAGMEEELQV